MQNRTNGELGYLSNWSRGSLPILVAISSYFGFRARDDRQVPFPVFRFWVQMQITWSRLPSILYPDILRL
jgi:hypothetical protein